MSETPADNVDEARLDAPHDAPDAGAAKPDDASAAVEDAEPEAAETTPLAPEHAPEDTEPEPELEPTPESEAEPEPEDNDAEHAEAKPDHAPAETLLDDLDDDELALTRLPARIAPMDSSQTVALRRASKDYLKHRLPAIGAMATALSWVITRVFAIIFQRVDFNAQALEQVERAQARGQVVFAFANHSFLDYLYFNWAFVQHGLPLVRFANGVNTMPLHGLGVWLRHAVRRSLRRSPAYQMGAFDHHVRQGDPVWLFLDRSTTDDDANRAFSQPYLLRLMQIQQDRRDDAEEALERDPRALDRVPNVVVVPLLLVWEKRPDPEQPSLVDDLFGTTQAPGFWRKALQFLNMSWQSFFVFGAPCVQVSPPIELDPFRAEYPEADMAEAAELLRDRLLATLAQERQVIMGPALTTTGDLKDDVLRRPAVVETIRQVAADEGADEADIADRARDQLDEIAADASLLWTKALGAMLSPIFYLIYRGFHIDMKGLARLRQVARDSRVILVPSHKSHIDYLVLSYVFYQHGLMPPHIAAGVNLSFWPMGPIFRRSGAFFLRRTFRGDPLYPVVFKQYLIKLLEERVMIEFFPEGTRSRTGKVLKPRTGMVQMIIEAFIAGRFEHLVFQPISIGYEKIIESGSYKRESLGADKTEESATSLLKASSVLASNYGRVFIEFAEPVDLASYMRTYQCPTDRVDPEAIERLATRLAHRVMFDIAESTPVTPTSLAAIVLMNAPGRGIGAERLRVEAGFLLSLLLAPAKRARLSTPLTDALERDAPPELLARIRQGDHASLRRAPNRQDADLALGSAIGRVLHEAMLLLERNQTLSIREVHDELFYASSESQRPELNYYKNNIIHFFVAEALLANALLIDPNARTVTVPQAQERALTLSRLFKHEFLYPERAPDDVERTQFESGFFAALRTCWQCGWVDILPNHDTSSDTPPPPSLTPGTLIPNDAIITLGATPAPALEFMRALLLPYIEGYAFVASRLDLLLSSDGTTSAPVEERELPKKLLQQAEVAHIQGDITFTESMSQPMFQNALRAFTESGLLDTELREGRRGRSTRALFIHPDWIADDRWRDFADSIRAFTGPNRRRVSDLL